MPHTPEIPYIDSAYTDSKPLINTSFDSLWNRWIVIKELLHTKSHVSSDNLTKDANNIIKFITKNESN